MRQKTLLNLGVHFNVDKAVWPRLCQRIEALTSGQQSLVQLGLKPEDEAEAQRNAALLVGSIAAEPGQSGEQPCYERIEVSSVRDTGGRSTGAEHAALEALSSLRFPELLEHLGFNRRQLACALASYCVRMESLSP